MSLRSSEGSEISADFPLTYAVEHPERALNRLTTFFRPFVAIPIVIVLASIGGYSGQTGAGESSSTIAIGGTGLLFLPPLLMLVFRQKYPRWWFDWNLELLRFINRVGVYLALLDDRYPSTDEQQGVHLEVAYPDPAQLNRCCSPAASRAGCSTSSSGCCDGTTGSSRTR